MAEEKKAKKPRAPKKAGAGTKLPEEVKQETASVTEEIVSEAQGDVAIKTEATSKAKTAKKAAGKRGGKKTESTSATEEKAQEIPEAEQVTETEKVPEVETAKAPENEVVKAGKPKAKRTRKKTEKLEEATPAEAQGETAELAPVKEAEEALADEPIAEVPADKPAEESAEKAGSGDKKTSKKQGKKQEKKQEQKQEKPVLTKAEKRAFVKKLIRDCLQDECKWSELIDRVAQEYKDAYPLPENDNLNDVKGRVGSIVHLLQEEGEIVIEGNLVKKAVLEQKTENDPTVSALNEEAAVEIPTETAKKAAQEAEEASPEEMAEKAVEVTVEAVEETLPTKEASEETTAVVKAEMVTPAPVYDLSALFDTKRPAKKSVAEVAKEKTDEQEQTKSETAPASAQLPDKEEAPAKKSAQGKPEETEKKTVSAKKQDDKQRQDDKQKQDEKSADKQVRKEVPTRRPMRGAKTDPLKDAFLKKLRSLGGNYFEYYAIYLLERYSRMNGRRLEGLRISGGEYDGGIDGELELTDRLGFRETIYIQAKNWEPTDDRWWIGETILQQFIGAVTYRQAKEGKQHCRGLFITTSAFTNGAKEMLDKMSDKFVGYDADDLYETAKECQFGLLKDEKGNWKVDEELLSGKKSFFFML